MPLPASFLSLRRAAAVKEQCRPVPTAIGFSNRTITALRLLQGQAASKVRDVESVIAAHSVATLDIKFGLPAVGPFPAAPAVSAAPSPTSYPGARLGNVAETLPEASCLQAVSAAARPVRAAVADDVPDGLDAAGPFVGAAREKGVRDSDAGGRLDVGGAVRSESVSSEVAALELQVCTTLLQLSKGALLEKLRGVGEMHVQ